MQLQALKAEGYEYVESQPKQPSTKSPFERFMERHQHASPPPSLVSHGRKPGTDSIEVSTPNDRLTYSRQRRTSQTGSQSLDRSRVSSRSSSPASRVSAVQPQTLYLVSSRHYQNTPDSESCHCITQKPTGPLLKIVRYACNEIAAQSYTQGFAEQQGALKDSLDQYLALLIISSYVLLGHHMFIDKPTQGRLDCSTVCPTSCVLLSFYKSLLKTAYLSAYYFHYDVNALSFTDCTRAWILHAAFYEARQT